MIDLLTKMCYAIVIILRKIRGRSFHLCLFACFCFCFCFVFAFFLQLRMSSGDDEMAAERPEIPAALPIPIPERGIFTFCLQRAITAYQ